MSVVIIGNENDFKTRVLDQQDKLCLVYFFAQWCGPCKVFKSEYERVAEVFKEVAMFKIDIDLLPKIAADYGVMSIPTIIAFVNGQEKDRSVGIPADFENWITSNK